MDADQIRRLRLELTRYLKQFESCFSRRDTRAYFPIYMERQLSDLGEKSCEPMALEAGIPPRNLQEFLTTYKWDEELTRDRLHELVVREHSGPNSIAIIDETSDVKKGDQTPGVKRQWCGTVGKTENCIVTVHLAYATGDFHGLLDGELFLPEGGNQVLPQQRASADQSANVVAGGVFPLARGAMFPGSAAGSRARPVGRSSLAGIETALDSDSGELLVSGTNPRATEGGKIRSSACAKCIRQSARLCVAGG